MKVRQALSETHDRFVLDAEDGPQLLTDAMNKFDGTFTHAYVYIRMRAQTHIRAIKG